MIRDTSAQDRPLPTQRRRRMLMLAIPAALLLAAGATWPTLQRMATTGAGASVSAARLTIAQVELGLLVRDIAGEGRVVAANSPTLFAPQAGALTLQVRAGDAVKRGQLLARIDSPELTARLAQEQSQLDALRTELLRAEVDARQQRSALQSTWENARIDQQTAQNGLARQTKAFEAGATAGMQVEQARDALEKARIALSHAEAGLNLKEDSLKFDVQAKRQALERQGLLVKDLQRQLAELEVRSPADGQVGQLFVAERAQVARDAQLLTVIDLSALEVQMQVAEGFARELAVGMPGQISGNGLSWPGRVSSISPEVVNGEVAARLRFDGADKQPEQLRQNQRLSVRVLLDRREQVLSIARGRFVEESGGAFAYVLRENDTVAEKTPVRLGARGLDKVEILSGLKPGERVVVTGSDAFQGAARVTIAN
ncbi:HlyD family efflux transporter periplasmic adaptor subunit [Roseateles sp. DAIF2]|uniref:efflux RND transporter periplasmic adaptor subunit n=1 Tax=Roseateles sp. DAIF2 TaxID=2714952 RepID=UPI0018A32EEE|nr:HlyD family efflux transporter periplasmic adaptor subunit [Roseateles sp. DAIF2]QPF73197.1 HlyD family efflux transporter periplasmic adaptor subunit [Roseateles sp. DAIF2]